MIYRLIEKKKNRCGECKNEDCSQAGNSHIGDMNCVSYKTDKEALSEWQQKKEDERKKKEEYFKKYGRGGGYAYSPDDFDDYYDEDEFETQTMDPDDYIY